MQDFDLTFPARRSAGLARLSAFLPASGLDYARDRNRLLPGLPGVSRLSPWVRYRQITEEEVLRAATAAQGDASEKFVSEVLWRSYWKGFLEMRPALWESYRRGVEAGLSRIAVEAGTRRMWEAACEGRTGIDGFDHWAQTLVRTGYLHNHARMWFASIWIFTLRLPWELGADFFLRHLIDGDPASNTLSWRWVAGLHTAGKTYLATPHNIEKNTNGRFRPEGLSSVARPVDGAPNPPPGPCPQGGAWDVTLPTALLLHEDDLSPDWLLEAGLAPVQTAFLMAPADRSPLIVAPLVGTFLRDAMSDCASRFGSRLGALHGPVEGPGSVDALVAWARASRAVQVVTPFAPVGPIATLLDELDRRLGSERIRLVRAMRNYDVRLWPHATHGFFRFREAIGPKPF